MEFTEFKAATVDDAITDASLQLGVPSTELVYEVIEEGSNGFLGIGKKPAVIKARLKIEGEDEALKEVEDKVKENKADKKPEKKQQDKKPEKKAQFKMEVKEEQVSVDTFDHNKTSISQKNTEKKNKVSKEKAEYDKKSDYQKNTEVQPVRTERVVVNPENIDEILEKTQAFLDDLFRHMNIETKVDIQFDKERNDISIELSGDEMGVLIGKRGNTLDALQYLTSLYCNKLSDVYVRVKMDTENYRARRRQTLEHLARNIAFKVKKTRRPVYLEPMNPYERRIIHSTLQNDRYVTTKSEGEEPYRKVVVMLKRQ